jgi:Protein kinase domain
MPQLPLPPAIERVVDAYKLRLFDDPHVPLDSFLDQLGPDNGHTDTTLRTGDRALLLRRLLEEERAAADVNCVPFDSYWSRPWFNEHIHDVVAVLLADRFEVERPIGAGGQGLVYLVKNLKVDRQEALKIFHLKNRRDMSEAEINEWRERFSRESKASDSLHRKDSSIRGPRDLTTRRNSEETARHHNVPIVYEVNQLNGIHYFTMQYIDGITLRELLEKTKGPIAPRQAAGWMLTVARTLALLHATGHIHRDVKPGNLMVDNSGTLYLVDFGLVKVISEGLPDLTQAGGIGTPNYMAREQLVDARRVSPKADVYSLGATFYHVLTGQVWQGTAAWPKPVPRTLRDLCTACLAQDPDKRPSASEVEKKLNRWLHGISRRQVLAVGAVALVGAGAAAWRWGVPKSMAVIREEARKLRGEYVTHLLHDRWQRRGWFLYGKNGDFSTGEVAAAGQAAYALLALPESEAASHLKDDVVARLAGNLAMPFDTNNPDSWHQLQQDADGRDLGWVYNATLLPTADPVLWLTIAHARLIGWRAKNAPANVNPRDLPEHFRLLPDHYAKLLDMLKAYVTPGKPGAWNRYANQRHPEESSSATSGLALLALLEAKAAGLDWFAAEGIAANPAAWIPKTIAFLGESFLMGDQPAAGNHEAGHHKHEVGWYCNRGREGACGDPELSLMNHSILLQAQGAGFEPMPCDPALVRGNLLTHLFADEFNRISFAEPKVVQAEVELDPRKIVKPDESNPNAPVIASEPLGLMWYPWALATAALALGQADRLGLGIADRTRIQLSLGGWTGDIGSEATSQIFKVRPTAYVAETLRGLSLVESLPT